MLSQHAWISSKLILLISENTYSIGTSENMELASFLLTKFLLPMLPGISIDMQVSIFILKIFDIMIRLEAKCINFLSEFPKDDLRQPEEVISEKMHSLN